MIIRVAMLGTGTPADPFRVPLPTYRLILHNPATMKAIVEIPDEDYAPPIQGENPVITNIAQVGNVITGLDAAHRARVIQRIKNKYQEHQANYDVQES